MQKKRESAPHDAVSVKVSRYWQMVWQDVPGQQEIGKVVSRVYVAACVAGFFVINIYFSYLPPGDRFRRLNDTEIPLLLVRFRLLR